MRKQSYAYRGLGGFRPTLLNNLLNITEIFLKDLENQHVKKYAEQQKKHKFQKFIFQTKQFYHYNMLNSVTLGTNSLVNFMRHRCMATVKTDGGHTQY